ncbi:glycosyltransferase family 4 protein [Flavobacteriaceae bacterium 14752]|uniref:glycosyltransferase family 4 protein n=1 Tax=Mesohalobacter salilacus TaxID=2491711 RepID=UPI000F63BA5A|nr:glycosyltransferase [Flavobacteriaceae bacterium 14752]
MKKLAIVITHPIQYYSPWFKLLAERKKLQLRVFYTWSQSADTVKDKTFGLDIKWDIPLLKGYDYEFVKNRSRKPGSHHFFGIDCPDLIPRLKSFSPDAILFFGWNFKSHLKAMRYFHGKVRVWFRGDSTLLDEVGGLKTKLRRIVLKTVYRYVDKAFYVGQANKAYFLKHGLSEGQLIYAPHAVDNERFTDNKVKKYKAQANKLRKELGIKDEDLVLIYAGKFEFVKQVDLLLKAIIKANLKRDLPIKIILVGKGPMEHYLKKLSKSYGFIYFFPFQNQSRMPVIYNAGDLFCLPSKSETWGLAVNEALSCGKAVLVSDKVGCSFDLVQHGINGYIFKHDNPNELISILTNLSKSKLNLMSTYAHKSVQNFNFLRIVSKLENNI